MSELGRSYSNNVSHLRDGPDVFIPTNLLRKDYVIFYHPSMERLATNLHQSLITRHNNIASTLGKITWKTFPDGFPDIFIHDVQDLIDRDVLFVAAFNQPSDIFSQLSVCQMIPTFRTRTFSIILPYNPVATMERSSVPGEVITGVTLSKMFGTISGKTEVFMVDLHTFHNLHYFPDHIHAVFVHSAHKMKQILLQKNIKQQSNVSCVFADHGAMVRYRYIFHPFDLVVCSKIREGDKRYITITQGQEAINGRDLVIIDDLVHSGGTLRECITELTANYKPNTISLFITHGIFENNSWEPFVELYNKGIIHNFYLCDTNPQAIKLDGVGPFKTISIADDLGDVLVHNRQAQYEELAPNEKNGGANSSTKQLKTSQSAASFRSILPTNDTNDDDQSLKSPVENQHQCQECTQLLHRHAKALRNQQNYFVQNFDPHFKQSPSSHHQHYSLPIFETRQFRPSSSSEHQQFPPVAMASLPYDTYSNNGIIGGSGSGGGSKDHSNAPSGSQSQPQHSNKQHHSHPQHEHEQPYYLNSSGNYDNYHQQQQPLSSPSQINGNGIIILPDGTGSSNPGSNILLSDNNNNTGSGNVTLTLNTTSNNPAVTTTTTTQPTTILSPLPPPTNTISSSTVSTPAHCGGVGVGGPSQ